MDYDFDQIAEEVFFPIYDIIAEDIIRSTGRISGRLLDIGCGGGHLGLSLLKKTAYRGTFVDISKEAIEIAEKRGREWSLKERSEFIVGDVHHLPFPDNHFDLIISRGSMGFWEDQKAAFLEIYRVLAPGGKTYIGSGLGNKETKKEIFEKMKKITPGWPDDLKERLVSLSTQGYRELFEALGFDFRIEESQERGRWIIIEK